MAQTSEGTVQIAGCGTSPDDNKKLYDQWAQKYEQDVRAWGYRMPEVCAETLKRYAPAGREETLKILDAGAGDGLSGKAIADQGFKDVIGVDISPELIKIANNNNIYKKAEVADLSKPLKYERDAFDAMTIVGVMTYLEPDGCSLDEFCRVVKTGGLVIMTHRTDKIDTWRPKQEQMEKDGKWERVFISEPQPYLPDNPEYADKIKVIVHVYRVGEKEGTPTADERGAGRLPAAAAEGPLLPEAEAVLREGYCVAEGALPPEVCDALRAYVCQRTDEAWAAGRSELFGNIQEQNHRWDLKLELCDVVRDALDHVVARVGGALTQIVGEGARVVELAAISSDPGAKSQAVHADTMHGVTRFLQSDITAEPLEEDEEEDDLGEIMRTVATETAVICTMLVALQDVEPDMGPTMVWPGTQTVAHHATLWSSASGSKLHVAQADALLGVTGRPMLLRKGDLVCYDSRTMHCGSGNQSRKRRSVLAVSVMGPGIRPEGTTWTMLPELTHRLPLSAFPLGLSGEVADAAPADAEERCSGSEATELGAACDAAPRVAASCDKDALCKPVPPLAEWAAVVQCTSCSCWRPCAPEEARDLTIGGEGQGFECSRLGFSCAQPQVYTDEAIDEHMA